MKKRTFLKSSSVLIAGTALSPLIACKSDASPGDSRSAGVELGKEIFSPFTLPELTYGFSALEPNIDSKTMEIHHDKHHAGYVRKLNAALENSSLSGLSLEEMLAQVAEGDSGVRNNGGGHYNHSLFWSVMSPNGGGEPSGDLMDAINTSFGDFEKFTTLFSTAAKTRFGSGWAWLCSESDGKLFVCSTPNQDNPLMKNLVVKTGKPLLGLDVWEHAYYLQYQNRRGDYVGNFFNLIDWNAVASLLG